MGFLPFSFDFFVQACLASLAYIISCTLLFVFNELVFAYQKKKERDFNKFIIFNVVITHCGFEIPSLVACEDKTVSVQYVQASLLSFMYFCLNKVLKMRINYFIEFHLSI